MKKQFSIFMRLGVVPLLTFFIFSSASAQNFINPIAFEDSHPAAASGAIGLTAHTSAYSFGGMNIPGAGSFDVVLAGWDDVPGINEGVSWRYLAPGNPTAIFSQGIIPYANVRDLEVGLVDQGGAPLMLVAYYLNGVGHFCDVYKLTAFGPAYTFTQTLSTMPFYTRISMDCHLLYAAAIVWQDMQGINTTVALASGGLTFSGVLTLNGSWGSTVPDCAFSHTPMGGSLNVHYTYYNPGSSTIIESSYDFWIMIYMLGGIVPVAVNDVNPVTVPWSDYPLIMNLDCPGHYNVENWAYTYTTDNMNISVRLVDYNTSGTPTTVIANNGSLLNWPINGSVNVYPFCAYDRNHTPGAASIQVGWHTYATDPATMLQAGYVSMQMNESGTAQINPLLPAWDYQTVANIPTWSTQAPMLSFSKQDDNFPFMYTVFPEYDYAFPGYRLENKYHLWSSPQFKGEQHNAFTCNDDDKIKAFTQKKIASSHFAAYPNPFSDRLGITIPNDLQNANGEITITDMTGKIIGKFNGKLMDANTYLTAQSAKLANGNYLLHINADGHQPETLKLTKAE